MIAEAESAKFESWDFGYLQGRLVESPTPWNYRSIIRDLLAATDSLVDIGTGGGELLASLHPLPKNSFATEGYPPNVSLAKRRLQPLGVGVVETYCDDNTTLPQRGALPFKDCSIGLVINRHESFVAAEVSRILRPLGRFVTQQVGDSNYPELNAALGVDEPPPSKAWNLQEALKQVEDVGLDVVDSQQTMLEAWFADVGAVVYYLKAVPWQIPGFSTKRYYSNLQELDLKIRRDGALRVTSPRFLVSATKPSPSATSAQSSAKSF